MEKEGWVNTKTGSELYSEQLQWQKTKQIMVRFMAEWPYPLGLFEDPKSDRNFLDYINPTVK